MHISGKGKVQYTLEMMINTSKYEFFIRNHFIINLVLDSLTFKKLLELQGKELRSFKHIAYCTKTTDINVDLHQNNLDMTLL